MGKIVCRGNEYHCDTRKYWHLAHPGAWMFFHNVFLNEGLLASASYVAQFPGLGGVASPYSLKMKSGDEKELAWEAVRVEEFPDSPSREGCIFLFDEYEHADHTANIWFPNQKRHFLEARILSQSTIQKVDSKWLDCNNENWVHCARQYWKGEITNAPLYEVIVHGFVYFPGWSENPFGLSVPVPEG